MITRLFKTILFCALISLTNCASLGDRYEKDKVDKIKTIAVVGFTFDAPMETTKHALSDLLEQRDPMAPSLDGETPTSKKAYDEVLVSLRKAGWKVKSGNEVEASPSVKDFYNKTVKIGLLPLVSGSGRYERAGIPQYVHILSLAGKQEFSKMARDLGVDAIATVYVTEQASATIPLVSKMSHSASVILQVFEPRSDSLVLLLTSNGDKVDGATRTKLGKDFLNDIEKGTMAGVSQFGTKLKEML